MPLLPSNHSTAAIVAEQKCSGYGDNGVNSMRRDNPQGTASSECWIFRDYITTDPLRSRSIGLGEVKDIGRRILVCRQAEEPFPLAGVLPGDGTTARGEMTQNKLTF